MSTVMLKWMGFGISGWLEVYIYMEHFTVLKTIEKVSDRFFFSTRIGGAQKHILCVVIWFPFQKCIDEGYLWAEFLRSKGQMHYTLIVYKQARKSSEDTHFTGYARFEKVWAT